VRHRMRWGALLVGAAAVAALAACGSSGNPAPASNADGANGFAAYTQCLARNGVVLPSFTPNPSRSARPGGRPSARPSAGTGNGGGGGFGGAFGFGNQPPAGVDQATWDKAMQACASVRPSASPGARGGNNSALIAYRNCLSEHGVTLASGGPGGGFGGLNTADPKVAAALSACAPLRPTGGPGGFGGGPRPTPTPTG
jgi:hypothetical protein